MKQQLITEYEVYEDAAGLNQPDRQLLLAARKNTTLAYAPYSQFYVSAAARLQSGQIVMATNQENAAYPVGICAERTLLGAISSQYPTETATTMAITYNNQQGQSRQPISPCGMCRQALLEYEMRWKHPIRLLLSGMEGKVIVIESTQHIMPFSFGADDLG